MAFKLLRGTHFNQADMFELTGPQWLGGALIGVVVLRLLLIAAPISPHFNSSGGAVRSPQSDQRGRSVGLALLLTLVVVYGSLVPLNYQPLDLAETAERFSRTPYFELGVGNRADWVANILLFMPLSFLWMAALCGLQSRLGWRLLCSMVVVLACSLLAFGMEFVQIWFPPRTVSQNDIVAEEIGTISGVAIWLSGGPQIMAWLRRSTSGRRPDALVDGCLQLYTAVLLGYSIMPLDVVTSWDELASKLEHGRITLASAAYTGSLASFLSHVAMDVLKFLPVGLMLTRLFQRRWDSGPLAAVLLGWAIVAAVESSQVFIYSRTAELVQVATGGLGIAAGSLLATCWNPVSQFERMIHNSHGGSFWWLMAWIGYATALLVFSVRLNEWEPGDLAFRDRLDSYLVVPFSRLYWGSEFHALTEILMKSAAFIPLGALSVVLSSRFSGSKNVRRAALVFTTLGCVVLAVAIELMQVTTHSRYGDVTDSILYLLGFWIGAMMVSRFSGSINRFAFV